MEGYERYSGTVLCNNWICHWLTKRSSQANLITGDEWMDMLKVRNQLAHDYDGVIVKEHCGTIVHVYIDKLYDFKKAVEKLLKE